MLYDWLRYFWPQLMNPWTLGKGIFNLPFIFILLQPLRLLGPYGSAIFLQLISVFIITILGRKMGLSIFRLTLVLLSPPVFWNIFMGQIDGLMMVAYLLPAVWSIPFVLTKPQTTFGEIWRAVKLRPIITVFLVILLIVLAYVIWGWPFRIIEPDTWGALDFDSQWNWSIWPWGLLLLPLLLIKDWRGRMFASPFLFPFVGVQSLIGPMLVVATLPRLVFVSIWFMTWIRWFRIHVI